MHHQRKELLFDLFFFIIPTTWAGSFIAGKYVISELDPIDSVFWRFAISALCMLPLLFIFKKHRHPDFLNKKFFVHMLIVVSTAGIGYHVFFFRALQYTTPTNTALIIALNPFFTAITEILVFRQRRPGRFYLGFIMAFAGAIWVNVSRNGSVEFSNLGRGELYCFIAAVLWSAYTILSKLTKDESWDSLWINAYNYFFTAVLMIPMLSSFYWPSISQSTWIGLLYMGIFPTAIGYTLFYVGVQKRGPAWATTFIYLVPSFTFILDYLFFQAEISWPMLMGTTAVVLGLIIGNLNVKRKSKIVNEKANNQ